ncbi:MAG: hypothetical protein H7328_01580 [Bdellovibrio sp.]|nr:hypothetical protein [Bdellovibrio sp.]
MNIASKKIYLCAFLLSGSFANAELSSDSPAASTLMNYPEGLKIFNDLNSKFSDVKILLLEQVEIEKRSGHNGGGVRQDPVTKKYEILISKDLPASQRAHAIAHELQHVRDEKEFDQFLETHPAVDAIGSFVIKGLQQKNKSEFIAANKRQVNFVMQGLFCQERRAYQTNINLSKQGLAFDNKTAIERPGQFIYDKYISTFGVEMTGKEIFEVEKKCLESKNYVDFMKAIIPAEAAVIKSSTSMPAVR